MRDFNDEMPWSRLASRRLADLLADKLREMSVKPAQCVAASCMSCRVMHQCHVALSEEDMDDVCRRKFVQPSPAVDSAVGSIAEYVAGHTTKGSRVIFHSLPLPQGTVQSSDAAHGLWLRVWVWDTEDVNIFGRVDVCFEEDHKVCLTQD